MKRAEVVAILQNFLGRKTVTGQTFSASYLGQQKRERNKIIFGLKIIKIIVHTFITDLISIEKKKRNGPHVSPHCATRAQQRR